ncbi:MAG TPA: serine/threonine-protein kinase, partial [bacterium]|nr:serine/threonine-protein kinase [bacterium]
MPPTDRLGRYQLLDRIGAGGMAEVHLARVVGAAGFEKLVVVKRLLPTLAAEKDYVKGFVDEGRIAASFSHANVVSTFDFGESDGSYFIAMEFVEGKNLRAILDALEANGERMPLPIALYLAAEACRGLDHAHTRTDAAGNPLSIVHRDVSPQNVVVSYDGDVKVLDFGIATSATRETRTAPGIVKGKLRYIAPEQVTGGTVDGRADLFAVGAMLHEILHGRRTLPDLDSAEI